MLPSASTTNSVSPLLPLAAASTGTDVDIRCCWVRWGGFDALLLFIGFVAVVLF